MRFLFAKLVWISFLIGLNLKDIAAIQGIATTQVLLKAVSATKVGDKVIVIFEIPE